MTYVACNNAPGDIVETKSMYRHKIIKNSDEMDASKNEMKKEKYINEMVV